jgi:hypothetical protein
VGQTGALLEWVDDLGNTLGVIDGGGLVGIGTAAPVQKLHVVGNGAVSAVFVEGGVGVGTVNPLATLHVYDEGTLTPGATQVIIQAGANQTGVNLLEWWDNAGTVLGGIDDAGNLFVNTNTTLGDAAGDVVTVNAGTVALPNIPSGSTATEVLVWNGGNVERRSAEGLAWLLTGNGGTNPAVNFLGTTDAQPLVIRTNNLERMRITADGGCGHWDEHADSDARCCGDGTGEREHQHRRELDGGWGCNGERDDSGVAQHSSAFDGNRGAGVERGECGAPLGVGAHQRLCMDVGGQ